MTAFGRVLDWFIAPPAADALGRRAPAAPPSGFAAPESPLAASSAALGRRGAAFQSPLAASPAALGGRGAAFEVPAADASAALGGRTAAGAGFLPPDARSAAPAEVAADAVITSAAVLGRPGEVEPVAAALALALRRESRAKTGAVIVAGPAPPEPAESSGGGAAARRLVARLEAHGFEAQVRGRLAWLRLDPADPQFAAAVRRLTLIAAPAVLAVTAPRTAALDASLAEQDLLLIVTTEPDGPLSRLAATGLPPVPVTPIPPLTRGPARAFARAGLRPPRAIRRLVLPASEPRR